MENKFTSFKATLYKGNPPEGGATDWWSKEDWDEFNEYVAELKRTGEYMKPVGMTYHFMSNPIFDTTKEPKTMFTNFSMLVPSGVKPNNFNSLKEYED